MSHHESPSRSPAVLSFARALAAAPRARRGYRALALCALLEACATTDTPAQSSSAPAVAQEQPPRRRRRRRRRAPAADPGAMPMITDGDGGVAPAGTAVGSAGGGGSFGTPVANAQAPEFPPAWTVRNGRGTLVCEGATSRPLSQCPQCRDVPDNAAIVRAFVAAERAVLQCEPPADPNGRLPMRAVFSGAGVPLEVTFPGVEVDQRVGLCMGQALCRMHIPTLRSAEATVNYEYVVLLPGAEE